MKIVEVVSRSRISTWEPRPDACLVSIWSTIAFAQVDQKDYPVTLTGWKDALRQDFDDVTTPKWQGFTCTMFNEDHAAELLAFIEKNDGAPFVAHCNAGVSRSVAVARFMYDFFGYIPRYYETPNDQFANIHVYNLLRRAAM